MPLEGDWLEVLLIPPLTERSAPTGESYWTRQCVSAGYNPNPDELAELSSICFSTLRSSSLSLRNLSDSPASEWIWCCCCRIISLICSLSAIIPPAGSIFLCHLLWKPVTKWVNCSFIVKKKRQQVLCIISAWGSVIVIASKFCKHAITTFE